MPRKLVVANWKMHGNLASNRQLLIDYLDRLSALKSVDIVVCVPYPYLAQAQSMLQGTAIAWGAQNLSKDAVGAFTGEVSANMLNDFGATHVIIGHSERATAYCESDENIAAKFMQAKAHGLVPILCVGETLIEREAGVMEMVVAKQIDTIINLYGADVFANAVVSYEPIWAIGTGLAASPDQAQSMHEFIRNRIANHNKEAASGLKILYGGSVNPQNAVQLFSMQDIDGGLIGKCSLSAQEFEGICQAAS
ncbi:MULTISPECIES: triose-phosphate isomerase [Methylotenera]|jgi:triosephosphate isomerase|uniref:Triosephosphate isomerase n=1 Tax=Methylotenera mobilis TaxID=359408 RepID=A0A351RBW8_9PROT|nr:MULTISPECIES: triose-phosphate isomerase [Methylotenera]HBA09539.1 triose-phosphate isomerase [Methylotenera mobilis]MDP3210632.1 triose-phosphate isomerase [Methylotenera sp.]MDP3776970.1 triose-phosphate isomerase [Methylotenera sp.]PPC95657.1 MAG: triose-phosphate isomerase [Methylotenera sp.]PPD49023.1 MAG: triose-phosphate isomerase [Methylotenera sp.]